MSQSFKNIQTLRPIIDPAAYPWLADPTGTADATAAFNAAYTAARLIGAEVAPTTGTYRFLGSLNPSYVTTRGPGTFTRETSIYTGKGVTFLHAGTVPLISPSAGGWAMDGITFYDPLQPGTGATPVLTRPPLISATAPARLIDWTFTNCIVVNCLDFLKVPIGSLAGDFRVTQNRIYAIRNTFWLLDGHPESSFVSDNIFTPGVFQTEAVFANAAMLAKWSEANGVHWAVDLVGATQHTSIDGIKSSNNLYFGNFASFFVASGRVDVSTSVGDTFDNNNRLVRVIGSGAITSLEIGRCLVYSNSGQTGSVRTRAVDLDTSGDVKLSISGRFQESAGDWIIDEGTGVTEFQFTGYMGPLGFNIVGSPAFAFRTGNPTGTYLFNGVRFSNRGGVNLDCVGLNPVDCEELSATGCSFYGYDVPVFIEATNTGLVNLNACVSRNTLGTKSVDNDSTAATEFDCGSRWDQPSDITPSV
jgi:hypothetical protein